MLASVMPGVVSANFWRDLTFFTCIPAAETAVTLPLFTSAKTSTFFPVVWILCLPFFLIPSPRRSFPLRWCFSFAKARPEASIVVAAAIIPSTRRRLIMNLLLGSDSTPTTSSGFPASIANQVSFVMWTEPAMNGPTTDKFQRFPIADIESYWTITNQRLHELDLNSVLKDYKTTICTLTSYFPAQNS